MKAKTIGEALGHHYVTVVAIGDSITAVNHWTMGGLNWVGHLQANLGTCFFKGSTVINSGIGGDNLPAGLARLERDVLRFAPQLTIISFGMNDARLPHDLGRFRKDLHDMIQRVRTIDSDILLRTPNPIINMADGTECEQVIMAAGECRYSVERIAEAIVEVAREEDTWLVDHYTLWRRSLASRYRGEMCMLMGNCMHPNANGHERFYHEMAPVFGADMTFQNEWQHILERQADEECAR